MFARAVRPAAHAARAARRIPVAPARRLLSNTSRPGPEVEAEHSKNLALVTGAVVALVTAGSIVSDLRKNYVHPSEPTEEEVAEEEGEAEAAAEDEGAVMVEAAIDSVKEKAKHALSAADAALADLIAEAETALGLHPASATDALAAEAASQGAFNEETGEINWDCPCLGGMATGPCGEEFKAAFSCFVYSEAEPKGIECVEKFKAMQDCFREHPDVYGEEEVEDEAAEEPPSESK
ncbi:uncharacterized protein CcaverHIS019_0511250 [Cutaneotrichosporon cavernicola]|uniref:Mitochondrial intermembrane space import and assembly protein 40 n=1 Tax=Cutaneotrichosporon cavernicola TaxID=279322 RepID=A0AA48QXM4_9TREE|nr:uncharacterized protein CcaverHIS019_0511250 [Cutaneotrichosporon cavernicola]BEI93497.1 hypothetical protein CcaverHIS019_0511250 [Cutaneotrichosporon cavernicola]BEJ01276.1 hypothetical protein CcaverHIS631_0511330 [Cutaneotrichosporon cavernicola]BEJ09043.1 hypothetical protein CcaverHIS641_0511370 [Cutaneotrichosporon cavernicola]